jgi:hypothetical protein
MGEYSGSALYISFGGTVLSGNFRKLNVEEGIKTIDATSGADQAEVFLAGVKNGKASLEMLDQTGGSAIWTQVAQGASGTLIWSPEGTAGGTPKHTATALVTDRKRDMPYDGVVVLGVDFLFTSVVTDGAN